MKIPSRQAKPGMKRDKVDATNCERTDPAL